MRITLRLAATNAQMPAAPLAAFALPIKIRKMRKKLSQAARRTKRRPLGPGSLCRDKEPLRAPTKRCQLLRLNVAMMPRRRKTKPSFRTVCVHEAILRQLCYVYQVRCFYYYSLDCRFSIITQATVDRFWFCHASSSNSPKLRYRTCTVSQNYIETREDAEIQKRPGSATDRTFRLTLLVS